MPSHTIKDGKLLPYRKGESRAWWEREIRLWVLNDQELYRAWQASDIEDVNVYVKKRFALLKKAVKRVAPGSPP